MIKSFEEIKKELTTSAYNTEDENSKIETIINILDRLISIEDRIETLENHKHWADGSINTNS